MNYTTQITLEQAVVSLQEMHATLLADMELVTEKITETTGAVEQLLLNEGGGAWAEKREESYYDAEGVLINLTPLIRLLLTDGNRAHAMCARSPAYQSYEINTPHLPHDPGQHSTIVWSARLDNGWIHVRRLYKDGAVKDVYFKWDGTAECAADAVALFPSPQERQDYLEGSNSEPTGNTGQLRRVTMTNYPLHKAAGDNDTVEVRRLIEEEADVNARDHWGNTPLHHAARYGSIESIGVLLEAGADADYVDEASHTPLQVAIRWCKEEAEAFLREVMAKQKGE